MNSIKSYFAKNLREYGIMAALALIVVLFQILTGGLLLVPNNVASLIQQNAYVMILTIGMVMVIVAGHIDLSVGSVVAFVGGVCGIMMQWYGLHWSAAVLVSLLVGLLIGCWQGFWVAYVGVPAFIVTLAGMLLFRGLAIVLVGTTVAGFPNEFNSISKGSLPNSFGFIGDLDIVTLLIGLAAIAGLVYSTLRQQSSRRRHGLPTDPTAVVVLRLAVLAVFIGYFSYLLSLSAGGTPIILVIVGVLIVVYSFVMSRTVFGRHIYTLGGNLKAARLSGIDTKKVNFMIFVNMGLLAAIAGVVTTARAGAAVAAAGNMYELDAIAAAFIGGTAVSGGIGKISGAIVGALIMGVLNMGLSIMNVDSAWQQAIKGLVLLVAVAFDLIAKRRSGAGA